MSPHPVRCRSLRSLLLASLVATLAHDLHADEAGGSGAQAERARIRAGRAAVEASFVERERECQTRFAVTSCIDAAKREQREQLSRLQAQEHVLDAAERKARAAQRMESIRNKISGEEARQRDAQAIERSDATPRNRQLPHVTVRPTPGPLERRDGGHAGPSAASGAIATSEAERRAEEARKTSEYEARIQDAQEHREAVLRRNAERTGKGKPVAPLPVPPAASAP